MKTDTSRKRTGRIAPALAAALAACACLAALAPSAARQAGVEQDDDMIAGMEGKKDEPRCVVYGRVTLDETNRPVRRARVTLITTGGSRSDLFGVTDSRGDFRIKNVPAGTYFISVDAPGVLAPVSFLSFEELQEGAFDAATPRKFFEPIEVNGKEDKEVTVRARRGAALGGVVKYADGDPAVGVQVHVLRNVGGRLEPFLPGLSRSALTGLRTDDRGAYRVAGLPPGEYVVAVTEAAEHGDSAGSSARDYYMNSGILGGMIDRQLLTTFHPSATRRKEAAAVKLDVGDERSDVDVTIPEREMRVIEGVVRGRRDKRPVPRALVSIARKGDADADEIVAAALGEMLQNSVRADEHGRWRLKEIPDGEYTISAVAPAEYDPSEAPAVRNGNVSHPTNLNTNASYGAPRTRPRKRYAPARREVEVSGSDLTDVTVEMGEGARITGTVTVEGGRGEPGYMQVAAIRASGDLEESVYNDLFSALAEGGTFTIEGLPPGKYFIHVTPYGPEGELYLKSLTWNGKDLLREPLEVGDAASVEGVRLVYGSDSARLEVALVKASDGRAATNVNVFLLPADLTRWNVLAPQHFCSTGDDGSCTISAPPGEYLVVLLPRRVATGSFEAEIKRRAAVARRVALRGGESHKFESTVAER